MYKGILLFWRRHIFFFGGWTTFAEVVSECHGGGRLMHNEQALAGSEHDALERPAGSDSHDVYLSACLWLEQTVGVEGAGPVLFALLVLAITVGLLWLRGGTRTPDNLSQKVCSVPDFTVALLNRWLALRAF